MLLSQGVWNNDKEELCNRSSVVLGFLRILHIVIEVGIDGILEVLNLRSVVEGNNITVVNKNLEAKRLGQGVELVLEVLSILNIFFEAENGPLLEIYGLANDLSENAGVIENLALRNELNVGLSFKFLLAFLFINEDAWSLKNLSINFIGVKIECKLPLFDFL
jgi:hypothetical protein